MTATAPQLPIGCSHCGGKGIYFDPEVTAGRYGSLKICSCIVEQCKCGGQRPYQFWDEDSRRWPCPCAPFRRRLTGLEAAYRQADIPARYRWKFQDDFLMQAPDGTAVPIAQEVKGYVSTLVDGDREPQRGFLLHGPIGTGKTLLACIMLNELILHRARSGRFLSLSRKYFQQLRDTFSEDSANYGQTWQIIDELCNLPYLVLDDLGIQRGTEWEMEVLYQLIDARYGDERFTVVTTNQPLEEIRQMTDGRIYSRLSEMCHFVSLQGVEDYREHLNPWR